MKPSDPPSRGFPAPEASAAMVLQPGGAGTGGLSHGMFRPVAHLATWSTWSWRFVLDNWRIVLRSSRCLPCARVQAARRYS